MLSENDKCTVGPIVKRLKMKWHLSDFILSDQTCETVADHSLFQWSNWNFLIVKDKSSVLYFSVQRSLCIMRCLFRWLMIQEGPSILLLLCCTFFFPPSSLNPAASLLRGLCMNSHCHVQGRVAQGQLIAFMIMISRQIYRACSEHIFQVLPTLLALDGGKWVYSFWLWLLV